MLRLLTKPTERPNAVRAEAAVATHDAAVANEDSTVRIQAETSISRSPSQENLRTPVITRMAQRKRRRRRAATVTLALAGGLGIRWWQATRPPVFPENVNSVTVPKPTGPNASHFYAAATDALTNSALEGGNLADAPRERQKIAVAENAETLRLLRQGFTYRSQGNATNWLRTTSPAGLSAPVPNYVAQRQMVRLLIAEAHVKAAQGDRAGALQSSLDAIRFGQDIGRDGASLMGSMVGELCVGIGTTAAPEFVNGLSAAEARAGIRRLEVLLADAPTATDAMAAEKQFGLGALREVFQARSGVSGELPALVLLIPTILYGQQGIIDRYSDHMDTRARQASLPYAQGKKTVLSAPWLGWLGDTLIPNFDRVMESFARHRAEAHILLAELALQAYRADHDGVKPATLEELTRGSNPYLTRVPTEPFSADGRAPLQYRNGHPYSVGADGKELH